MLIVWLHDIAKLSSELVLLQMVGQKGAESMILLESIAEKNDLVLIIS